MPKYLFFVLCLVLSTTASAQISYEGLENYNKDEIEKITFNAAAKQNSSYPEDWNKLSAIYLNWSKVYELKMKGEIKAKSTQLIHRKIKLLDDSAVEYFSEIFLPGEKRTYGFKREDVKSDVRVIKNDGAILPISSDEYILNEDDNTKKLAVPGLEKGDILEYYIFVVDTYIFQGSADIYMGTGALIYDYFPLQGDYPILNFDYTIQNSKYLQTSMLCNNDAIKIKSDYSNKKFNVQSISAKNIENGKSEIWDSPYRDHTFIKTMVSYKKKSLDHLKPALKKEDVIAYVNRYFAKKLTDGGTAAIQYRKSLKRRGISGLKGKTALLDFYYFVRQYSYHYQLLRDDFTGFSSYPASEYIIRLLIWKLRDLDIDFEVLAIMPRENGKIDDLLNNEELHFALKVNIGDGLYFSGFRPYMEFNYFLAALESSDAYAIKLKNKKVQSSAKKITTLVSNPKSNAMVHKSKVKISHEDNTTLEVATDIDLTGHQYLRYIYPLTDWYSMTYMGIKAYKFIPPTNGIFENNQRKELKRSVVEKRKEYMKEQFEAYAKNHYTDDIEDIRNTKSELQEDRGKPSVLNLHFDCDMKEVLKKVGPNFILKIGKFVGGQVHLDDSERVNNIYMDYPRMFDYTVEIALPEGYSVEGLEDLDTSIDNTAGTFELSHKLEGQKLTIHFMKAYKNNFQPQKDWPLMKEFLGPANVFEAKEILLRKR